MSNKLKTYHKTLTAMATRMDIVLTDIEQSQGEQIFKEIYNELNRIENKFSYFKSQSIISVINQSAGSITLPLDEESFRVLSYCKDMYEVTNGYFNIGARPLLEYFMKSEDERGNLSIEKIRNNIGLEHMFLDNDKKSITLKNSIIQIDLGGYGKGYALDQINNILNANHCESAFISFGESSMLAYGHHPLGKFWNIDLPDPISRKRLHTFQAKNKFISTSGITESNIRKHKGIGHLINPISGKPVNNKKSVSVMASTGILSEIASTALMACEKTEQKNILKKLNIEEAIEIEYSDNIKEVTLNPLQCQKKQ